MRNLGGVLGAVLAATAFAALLAMHALPASVLATAPPTIPAAQLTSDHTAGHLYVLEASIDSALIDAARIGNGLTDGHGHTAWHLCLAILAGFFAWASAVAAGRTSSPAGQLLRQFRPRGLIARSLDPPHPVRLDLLRC